MIQGAYIIKNVIDVYGEVDVLGYFLGSDYASEYYDSHMLLHGGTGLINKDSILKPAAFAYSFLHQLYPYFVAKGEHYLMTTDCHGGYTVVCHNQKSLNYNYYFAKEENIEKESIWKYFEDLDNLQIKIQLLDVENGEYQVKVQKINEHHGSILDLWKEMDFYKDLSLNDIKYLRRNCNSKLTIHKEIVDNKMLELVVSMEPNEIVFVKFIKI